MGQKHQEIALVTGASRGIGAATATRLAEQGFVVCVNYHSRKDAADAVVSSIKATGGHAFAVQADISQEEEVMALFACIDTFGIPLTRLVNNAGILFTQSKLVDMNADRINKVLLANVTGSFLCAREAIKRMAISSGGKGGAIVNVSSGASRSGSPKEYVDYAASKGAVDTLTIGLSKEVAEEGIRVNGVRPGLIHTDIHADGGEPDRIARLTPRIPLQRGGSPEEVAAAICFLLSNDASFSTGTIIDVTGGV
ncbi:NAD(P)-dependent oxidoreductase [Enterovibrio norvegicus FF-454]|uniref:NAD(P)-dependent oxidoreductase n=1 Tax=Enterovibrio norvegicus FF-454 TaxID=1185651 RepID=A0A1E5C8E4_9GAMM|nr:SDR family oxidoreductase [Enterovibrio norvegicus]OEE61793.1 NAD(P)-dependent oxidoreductase [Enterovibrio norvegicus FF-454]